MGRAEVHDPEDRAVTSLALSLLSDAERAIYRTLSSSRRRAEFVAGRVAVRRALAEIIGERAVEQVSVLRETDGAPRLLGLTRPIAISISHGLTRAVAIAAEGSAGVGVDLCDRRDAPRIRRVAMRAFPREAERVIALVTDDCARAAWALKEAIGKAMRIGLLYDAGFARIHLLSIDPPHARVEGDPRLLTLAVRVHPVDEGVEATAMVTESL
ncbi:MAG: hypothetical protein NVS3B20_22080 [Polyangiales bacterium]